MPNAYTYWTRQTGGLVVERAHEILEQGLAFRNFGESKGLVGYLVTSLCVRGNSALRTCYGVLVAHTRAARHAAALGLDRP